MDLALNNLQNLNKQTNIHTYVYILDARIDTKLYIYIYIYIYTHTHLGKLMENQMLQYYQIVININDSFYGNIFISIYDSVCDPEFLSPMNAESMKPWVKDTTM